MEGSGGQGRQRTGGDSEPLTKQTAGTKRATDACPCPPSPPAGWPLPRCGAGRRRHLPLRAWTWFSAQTWRRHGARCGAEPLAPRPAHSQVSGRLGRLPPRGWRDPSPGGMSPRPCMHHSLCPGSGGVPEAGGKPVTPGGRRKERGEPCARSLGADLARSGGRGDRPCCTPAGREGLWGRVRVHHGGVGNGSSRATTRPGNADGRAAAGGGLPLLCPGAGQPGCTPRRRQTVSEAFRPGCASSLCLGFLITEMGLRI